MFEILTAALRSRGGQVLKFIGDGMLATFSFEDADRAETCRRALDAATEATQGSRCSTRRAPRRALPVVAVDLALHLGEVLYGNVGATDMQREVDGHDRKAGRGARRIEHREPFVASAAASSARRRGVYAIRIFEGQDREHAVADKFEHLTAVRAQGGGEDGDVVKEVDDDRARKGVASCGEAADVCVRSTAFMLSTERFDRAGVEGLFGPRDTSLTGPKQLRSRHALSSRARQSRKYQPAGAPYRHH